MKAVIHAALASKNSNDNYGARKLFLENRYGCPELFAILFEDINLIGGGTCRNIRICFLGDDEPLTFPKGIDIGTYSWLYNRRFHIVATRWKDYKTLQFISSLRKTVITEVSRR